MKPTRKEIYTELTNLIIVEWMERGFEVEQIAKADMLNRDLTVLTRHVEQLKASGEYDRVAKGIKKHRNSIKTFSTGSKI